jgi:hypothetical protein
MNELKYEIRKDFHEPMSGVFGYICFLYVFSDEPLNQIKDSFSSVLYYPRKTKQKNAIQWRLEDDNESKLSELVELKIKEIKKILNCEPEITTSEFN